MLHWAPPARRTIWPPAVIGARKRASIVLLAIFAFLSCAGLPTQTGVLLARDEGGSVERAASALPKRVIIDKTRQLLRAYEGNRLVFRCRVSTGRGGSTPSGRFFVRGKERMHYSSRYHNAPMPYSIHLRGHYFIHGYSFVPPYPASHGCIRVPLRNGNPAKRLYDWVDIGTLVIIKGSWGH